jgi:S1-C subfamily serine protease
VTALLSQIAALTPGSLAKLRVLREKKSVDLEVTVGKRPRARAS